MFAKESQAVVLSMKKTVGWLRLFGSAQAVFLLRVRCLENNSASVKIIPHERCVFVFKRPQVVNTPVISVLDRCIIKIPAVHH